jgi:enoyl-CoA hydratase/carnithine racemase
MGNVEYATDGPIGAVTINRPEVRNAVDRSTAEQPWRRTRTRPTMR